MRVTGGVCLGMEGAMGVGMEGAMGEGMGEMGEEMEGGR